MGAWKTPLRKDGRVIVHFDYDCFYAAVFEAKNPALKSLPLAVQQKHIIVTCNYEARRRGLYKLQLIREAKRVCPDVIIELGEDISKFRDASKDLYNFIKDYSWNGKAERLGFDEVWMDVTDMVNYNIETINRHDLERSFFQTSQDDPTKGFPFDASIIAGHSYPKDHPGTANADGAVDDLTLRLRLGSHFALYVRHQLEQQKGYTCTVGIATSKLTSKLVGNINKPKGQTTLMPPLDINGQSFMDGHDIGKVPGVGFKLSQKLREFILQRPAVFEFGLIYGGTKENVSVADVRNHPNVNPEKLEELLAGPGSPHGIGNKVWCLLHGIDDTEVSQAQVVPRQISIEDSYIRLDTMPEVLRELEALAKSLVNRIRIDLLTDEDDFEHTKEDAVEGTKDASDHTSMSHKIWLAHPKTLRLTTRPRPALQPDGTRMRSFKRISHSGPLPNFVFNLHESVASIANRLVYEILVNMFRKLHPEKAGWNLSLVNLAVTNMAETAGESKTANGRNIGHMFKRQDDVLKDFQVTDMAPFAIGSANDADRKDETDGVDGWEEEGAESDYGLDSCPTCGSRMPSFAMVAHQRFHSPWIT